MSLQRLTGSYPRGRKRGVGGDNYTEIQHFLVYKYDKSTGYCAVPGARNGLLAVL